jgi:histone demethylase JARID1
MKEAGGEKVATANSGRMASAALTAATATTPASAPSGRMGGGGATATTTSGKNQPSLSKIKYQEQKQQRDEYVKKEVEKITKQYGFQSGARHTMETMKRYSDYFKSRYFSDAKTGNPVKDISIPEMEREFWRIIENSEGRNIEVIYGADIATIETGSGMPTTDHKDEEQKKFANNPWNVTKMPYNPSSCLSHVERTTGITVPWLYFGMTLSTFCWHVEDHHFYSVNYHHFGDPKVWYCIPAEYSQQFERLMRTRLPHLFEAQPDLLHSLVTILSPKEIKAAGIPVYRVQQNARSYIITFPYSYHAGFNTGYNCAEAVNFAPVDWLPFGAFATERYVGDKRYQSVAHDQLLLTLTNGCDRVPGWKETVKKEMEKRVKIEEERREKAKPMCGEIVKMEDFCDFNELDCCVCLGDLNWAGVVCECTFRKGRGLIYCLRCVDKGCKCEKDTRKMVVRQTIEELKELVKTKCAPCQ